MNIIFLDIDGVLTSARTGWMNWDIYATTFLKWCCENSNTKIVISSTWRCNRNREFFADIFQEHLHEDWMTGVRLNCRGNEIQTWLDIHPEVLNYVIIDDDSDMLPHQLENLILTNTYNGLMFEDMEKLREKLNLIMTPCNMNLQTIIQHPNMFSQSKLYGTQL